MPELPWPMVKEGIKKLREVAGGENTQAMTNNLDDWSGPGKRNIGRKIEGWIDVSGNEV